MSLINIFRKPRNKKFRYSPRYSKSNKTNLYGFDSAYSKYRESNSVFDKSNAWDEARLRSRNRSNALFSKTILYGLRETISLDDSKKNILAITALLESSKKGKIINTLSILTTKNT